MNCAKYQLDKNLKGRNIFSYKALYGIGTHMGTIYQRTGDQMLICSCKFQTAIEKCDCKHLNLKGHKTRLLFALNIPYCYSLWGL